MDKDFETQVLTRLAVIESKIDGLIFLENAMKIA